MEYVYQLETEVGQFIEAMPRVDVGKLFVVPCTCGCLCNATTYEVVRKERKYKNAFEVHMVCTLRLVCMHEISEVAS